jgi:O-methyltransferase
MRPLRQFAKQILVVVTARIYERRPLSSWPAFLSELQELKVPQSVVPQRACSPTGSPNINMLIAMIDATDAVPGDIAECGVYRGASIVPMAIYLRQKRSPKTILGFDSFEGFDESIQLDLELGGRPDSAKKVGGLGQTSCELVQSKLARFHLNNTVIVKGYFRDTLPKYRDHRFSFVHLDCDMYASYKQCLEFFYPRINSNGILLLDEYNDPPWPGCNLAVDNFLADKPENLQSMVRDNYQKFFLVKN